jgi:hypothetical protein
LTSPTQWDRLVSELKSLRQRRGLTLRALAACPTVLAVMNNPPIQEGFDKLVALVQQLGDDERAQALKHAYAIGHKDPKLLMSRRTDLQASTGRDPKTLAGYENAMIEELASRLLGVRKPGVSDSHVHVIGCLVGEHIQDISVSVIFPEDGHGVDAFERTIRYENRSHNHSMPALLYQLPHDWEPKRLTLALSAVDATPALQFWATPARELLDLMFATHGGSLPVVNGVVSMQIDEPKAGVIYAVYWTSSTRQLAADG